MAHLFWPMKQGTGESYMATSTLLQAAKKSLEKADGEDNGFSFGR